MSYKLSGAAGATQYISAAVYANTSNLGDFVAKNDTSLRSLTGLNVLREQQTVVCGSEPASEIEYSQSGLVRSDPNGILDVERVRTFKDGWAYVTTFIRPWDSPRRRDAEQWIHSDCMPHG